MNAPLLVAPTTIVRRARLDDIAGILRVERAAWPTGECMQADADMFAHRIVLGGMFVAQRGERIVGCLTTFRPRWASASAFEDVLADAPRDLMLLPARASWERACRHWRLPADWHAATADGMLCGAASHRPDGDVVFGVGIATDPSARGSRVAQTLLEHALADARETGARMFAAYGRLPQYYASSIDLDTYLLRPRSGPDVWSPHDFGFRLHWYLGARPAARPGVARFLGIPSSMRDDPESRGAGVLIVNPLEPQ